jgi:DNA polymerase III epsilon subunit-like protein
MVVLRRLKWRLTMDFKEPPLQAVEVMIDLETMGTDPYSPILAIGAVRFIAGDTYPMPPFYQAITLESCLEVGLRSKADTILWWMRQSSEAKRVFEDPQAVTLPLALDAFTDWWGARPDRPWGNSARFDLGLLSDAYKACGKTAPWLQSRYGFASERCYRTLKELPGMDRFKLKRSGTHHNALDDAISQARHCREMLMYLQTAGVVRAATEPDRAEYDKGADDVRHYTAPQDKVLTLLPGLGLGAPLETAESDANVPQQTDPEAGFVPMHQADVQQASTDPDTPADPGTTW